MRQQGFKKHSFDRKNACLFFHGQESGKISTVWKDFFRWASVLSLYLVFWSVIELWVVPLRISIVEQMVVDQIPSPTLVIGAKQSNIPMTLIGSFFSGNTDHGYRAQRTLPNDFPRVSSASKSQLASCSVCRLCNWVSKKHNMVSKELPETAQVLETCEVWSHWT